MTRSHRVAAQPTVTAAVAQTAGGETTLRVETADGKTATVVVHTRGPRTTSMSAERPSVLSIVVRHQTDEGGAGDVDVGGLL